MEEIKGVNLGNWLVLEKWMDPAIFDGTDAEDETWLCRILGEEEYSRRLRAHRDSFIGEKDFEFIAERGCNLVRIPVPYFIFGDRKPFPGCIEYLDRAFEWAKRWGLKILIDLHTTPGGQNGYDNGGIVGVCKWHTERENVLFTLRVLERLAARYADRTELFGIEPVNEPISLAVFRSAPSTPLARDKVEAEGSSYVPMGFLKGFYKAAYKRLRKYLSEDKAIVFHDGFRLPLWGNFLKKNGMKNVFLDFHPYIWAMEMFMPIHRPWVYKAYLNIEKNILRLAQRHTRVIVGEWSICNRYAVDMNLSFLREGHSDERRRRFRSVARMEMDAFQEAAGMIYWSYRLGRDVDGNLDESWKESWSWERCIKHGWLD